MKQYKVFTRNWYRIENGKLVPNPTARKNHLCYAKDEREAQDICRVWNANHNPGKLSRKAEYTSL